MTRPLFYLLLLLSSCLFGQHSILDDAQDLLENTKYIGLDSYVRRCPNSIEKDPDQLVSYLEKMVDTDLEKARALYVWLADNIIYDAKSINKNKFGDNTALGVLKSKKAVCEGYAKLFEYLGQKMDLDILLVGGYCKSDLTEDSWDFTDEDPDHAWNVIKINGEWRVFDATWGAGNGEESRGKLEFTKSYTDNWFNLSPYEAIFTHFPEDTALILTTPKLTLEKFENLQGIPVYAFTTKLLNAEQTYLKAVKKPSLKFPTIYPLEPHEFQVLAAPKEFRLRKRKSHRFEFFASGVSDLFIYKNDEPFKTFANEEGGHIFSLDFTSKEEEQIEIVIKTIEGQLFTILEYEIY